MFNIAHIRVSLNAHQTQTSRSVISVTIFQFQLQLFWNKLQSVR